MVDIANFASRMTEPKFRKIKHLDPSHTASSYRASKPGLPNAQRGLLLPLKHAGLRKKDRVGNVDFFPCIHKRRLLISAVPFQEYGF